MSTEPSIMLPLALAAAGVGIIATASLSVMMVRLRRERDEFSDLLIDNYRRCVTGLQEILAQRMEIRQRLDRALRESTEELKPEAEAIARRLGEGARALRQSLLHQVEEGSDRLCFDFALLHSEIGEGDAGLARAGELLLNVVRLETAEHLREEIAHLKRKHDSESKALKMEIERLGIVLQETQTTLKGMADPADLERANRLADSMKRDIDLLIEGLFDGTGQVIEEIGDDDVDRLKQQMEELSQKILDADDELMSAPEDLVPTMGRWARLRRIRRAAFGWLLESRELRRRVANLEHSLEEMEEVMSENQSMLEEFQQMEAKISNERHAGDDLRMAKRKLAERLRALENVENENKYLVRDLESARAQVEEGRKQILELREGQAETGQRNLKKLEARVAELEAELKHQRAESLQIQQQYETIDEEANTLREQIQRLEAERDGRPGGSIIEGNGSDAAGSGGECASMDLLRETAGVEELSEMLGAKIAEAAELRDELKARDEKIKADAKMIRQLEVELESLANEYQRLFDSKSA